MSVRLNANEPYTATTGLPTGSAWTAIVWWRIAVDRNDYSTAFSIDNNTDSAPNVRAVQTEADGVRVNFWAGGTTGFDEGQFMVVGDWHRLALVVDGTTTTMHTAPAGGSDLTYFGIFSASSAGTLLAFGILTVAKPVLNGDTANFPSGSLQLKMGDPGDSGL